MFIVLPLLVLLTTIHIHIVY